jgi:hypothetical protein
MIGKPIMNNYKFDWKSFLEISRNTLGKGARNPCLSASWCSFTTFCSLQHNVHYWNCGFPNVSELLDDRTIDGGLWSQEFFYEDMAHVIIPSQFYWENSSNGIFQNGYKKQNIVLLSKKLRVANIRHRLTDIVLEVKLY